MRCSELRIIKICLVFFCLFLPVNACNAAQAKPQRKETPVSNAPMTQEELQSAVISYANRFIATVGQAAFRFENKLPTPEARLIAAARKVYSVSAVTEIAAGIQSRGGAAGHGGDDNAESDRVGRLLAAAEVRHAGDHYWSMLLKRWKTMHGTWLPR